MFLNPVSWMNCCSVTNSCVNICSLTCFCSDLMACNPAGIYTIIFLCANNSFSVCPCGAPVVHSGSAVHRSVFCEVWKHVF